MAATHFMASSSLNCTPSFLNPHFTESMPLPLPNTTLMGACPTDFRAEREEFGGIFLAAVFKPAGDDAGLDLEERVAHHLPVGRNRMAGELRHKFRQAVELVVLEAGVDAVDE